MCVIVLNYSRANAFALFLKSQRKWVSPELKESSVLAFRSRVKTFGYSAAHILPHGSYLINLGNPDEYVVQPVIGRGKLSKIGTGRSESNRTSASWTT